MLRTFVAPRHDPWYPTGARWCPSLGALVVPPSLRCPSASVVPEPWFPSLGALVVAPSLRCPGARALVPWLSPRASVALVPACVRTLLPAGAPLVPKNMFGVHAGIILNRNLGTETQLVKEGQTKPWERQIRILREILCIHAFWKASTTL